MLYYAYFQYGIELYGTSSKTLIKYLAVMQHRAIKALFNLDPLTSSANLHKIYKILNIDDQLLNRLIAKPFEIPMSGLLGMGSSKAVPSRGFLSALKQRLSI